MLISNSNPSFAMHSPKSVAKAPVDAQPSAATDTFTLSSQASTGTSLKEWAGVALTGAAGGAIGSLAPGYWSVPANLVSGAGTGAGGAAIASTFSNNNNNGYSGLLVVGGGIWGGASGLAAGIGTNLLELTGMPRLAAGALSGSIASVAMYSFLNNR